MSLYVTAIIAGLTIGSIYAIVGIGYTVIFSATRVFNLAQGDLLMVSVMMSYFLLMVLKWPMVLAAIGATLTAVGVALIEERTVVRKFLSRPGNAQFGWFIATLGFSLVVQTLVFRMFGNHAITPIASPFDKVVEGAVATARLPRSFTIASDIVIEYRRVFVIAVFALTIIALEFFFQRSWLGQAMRATSEDRDAASLLGINPASMSRGAFALAGLVAGVAGVVIAPITFSNPAIGLIFTLKGFLALAIGGFGSVRGAIVGGLGLGVAEQLWNLKYPGHIGSNYEILVGLILVLTVLLVRPQGLFKNPHARTV
jgi:branched-chain amino acid transport system permease protein